MSGTETFMTLDEEERQAVERAAELIAMKVVEKLDGPVISSVLPAAAGEWLRQAAEHGHRWQSYVIYLNGPNCLTTQWIINTDGTLQLEIRGPDNSIIWRGVFHPAKGM